MSTGIVKMSSFCEAKTNVSILSTPEALTKDSGKSSYLPSSKDVMIIETSMSYDLGSFFLPWTLTVSTMKGRTISTLSIKPLEKSGRAKRVPSATSLRWNP